MLPRAMQNVRVFTAEGAWKAAVDDIAKELKKAEAAKSAAEKELEKVRAATGGRLVGPHTFSATFLHPATLLMRKR